MLLGDEKYKRPIGVLFDTGERRRIAGQLKLKKGNLFDSNVVSIADDKFDRVANGGSLHGDSEVGRVSLLECVRGGGLSTTINQVGSTIYHGDVSFRYALFGKRHLDIDQKCIRGIQFTLEGAESSVFMHDKSQKFGYLHDPDKAILNAIEKTRPESLKGEFVEGKAMVFYFTGNGNVLPRFETSLGIVHVGRSIRFDFFGRIMGDTSRITVDFSEDPTTLDGAWEKMRQIRQFFAWMMGYAPGWKDVLVFTSRLAEDGSRTDMDGHREVFAPNEWEEVPESMRQCGALIDASRYPDHFAEVMKKWLKRNCNAGRRSANARYFSGFPGNPNRFIEEGIVSAANTFDLLPDEDKPKVEPLPKEILDILNDASERVRACKDAKTQGEAVSNALGRIRRNEPLRSIVEHRAKTVLDHFGKDRLKHLHDMIRLAVKCRNHYTHGPDDRGAGDVDYTDLETVLFLTETLGFIYGTSELLICGWDPARSARDERHPLREYIKSYDIRRSIFPELK